MIVRMSRRHKGNPLCLFIPLFNPLVMSSAVWLRKNLLSMLQEKILPELQRGNEPRILLAKLPLRESPEIAVREMEYPPLREADVVRIYPEGRRWPQARMHASHFPTLFYVVEGEADLLMGVTASMRNQLSARNKQKYGRGGYIFSLPRSTFFLVPPEIPQKTDIKPWQRDTPHRGRLCLFHLRILPVGALCNFSTMTNGEYQINYSLLIEDAQLLAVVHVLMDELSAEPANADIVRAQLLTLMVRLQRGMTTQIPAMTDGLYSLFPDRQPHVLQNYVLRDPRIQQAHEYIRLRINEPLTPAHIAGHLHLTAGQLNWLFKTNTGLSVMNYVNKMRMESAQLLLSGSDLSVQEIAELVGYRDQSYFTRRFRSSTGQQPLRYRQANRHSL